MPDGADLDDPLGFAQGEHDDDAAHSAEFDAALNELLDADPSDEGRSDADPSDEGTPKQ